MMPPLPSHSTVLCGSIKWPPFAAPPGTSSSEEKEGGGGVGVCSAAEPDRRPTAFSFTPLVFAAFRQPLSHHHSITKWQRWHRASGLWVLHTGKFSSWRGLVRCSRSASDDWAFLGWFLLALVCHTGSGMWSVTKHFIPGLCYWKLVHCFSATQPRIQAQVDCRRTGKNTTLRISMKAPVLFYIAVYRRTEILPPFGLLLLFFSNFATWLCKGEQCTCTQRFSLPGLTWQNNYTFVPPAGSGLLLWASTWFFRRNYLVCLFEEKRKFYFPKTSMCRCCPADMSLEIFVARMCVREMILSCLVLASFPLL